MNHMKETAMGKPKFRPGTGWGSLTLAERRETKKTKAKPKGPKTGLPRDARYEIEGEWLTTGEIADDPRNHCRTGRRSVWRKIDQLAKEGKQAHVSPCWKTPTPPRPTHSLTWADFQIGKGGRG